MKGVEEFGDSGMVLSFGMMLRPSGLQSMIRRRANLMIREAFKENGIEFATPSVQVGSNDRDGASRLDRCSHPRQTGHGSCCRSLVPCMPRSSASLSDSVFRFRTCHHLHVSKLLLMTSVLISIPCHRV